MAYWSVEENEIKTLPRERFNTLIYDLVKAEAASHGIPISNVIYLEEEKKMEELTSKYMIVRQLSTVIGL